MALPTLLPTVVAFLSESACILLKQISSLYKAISEPFAVNCVGKTRIHAFAHANTSSECTSTFRPGIKAAQEKKETPRDDKKFLFWSPELCIP
ncbi:hypothetical protein Y032_0030g2019 [Ancylostoma ceylanicum]|uniref:Uncharacterized protein n=1 Tax=Ancylostoma ceylanicum TaxID=53326 RepID=A0A016URD2_9BILA|nr:hypothetical protein Y032_0030g2019 [Ancylostoma ceylanicum]